MRDEIESVAAAAAAATSSDEKTADSIESLDVALKRAKQTLNSVLFFYRYVTTYYSLVKQLFTTCSVDVTSLVNSN